MEIVGHFENKNTVALEISKTEFQRIKSNNTIYH